MNPGVYTQEVIDVAIPLGQGQVFNAKRSGRVGQKSVAIPLGQGQVFNKASFLT